MRANIAHLHNLQSSICDQPHGDIDWLVFIQAAASHINIFALALDFPIVGPILSFRAVSSKFKKQSLEPGSHFLWKFFFLFFGFAGKADFPDMIFTFHIFVPLINSRRSNYTNFWC
jgi:hypothetical protein